MKKFVALLLALLMIVSLAACGEPKTGTKTETKEETKTETKEEVKEEVKEEAKEETKEESKAPSVLNVGMTTSMGDLSPFSFTSPGKNQIRYWTQEFLAVFENFGETWETMEYQLAKEITKIDDRTWQVEIYDYIVDAIGNPITANDVAFCLNTMVSTGCQAKISRWLEAVTVIDDYTVEIKGADTSMGMFEFVLAQSVIVSEKTYTENEATMNTTPITTGPYQIVECVDGSYYVAEKNENYWQKPELANVYAKQPVDSVKVFIFTESSQATMALQTGEVDVVTSVKGNDLNYFVNGDGSDVEGFTSTHSRSTAPCSLFFNMAEGENGDIFRDDLALRQAICYAVDQEAIVSIAYAGRAEALHDITVNSCSDYNPQWDEDNYYDYDLDKAKELLAQSAYKDDKVVRVIAPALFKDVAQVVYSQILELGVNAELTVFDDSLMATAIKDPAAWDIMVNKNGTDGPISNIYDVSMLRNKNGVGGKNFIVDDKLEELIIACHSVETNSRETADALHYYVADNAIMYGLTADYTYSVAREGITPKLYPFGYLVATCCDFD